MGLRRIPAAYKFVAVVSITLTAVMIGAVLMQARQNERASVHDARRSTEQMVAVIAQTLYVSPELFRAEILTDIISRFSMVAGNIDRISFTDHTRTIIADFDQSRIGRKTGYVTTARAYDSGAAETVVTKDDAFFSPGGAGAHIELSARILGPFDRTRDTNLLGMITVEASHHTGVNSIDFRLIGLIGVIIAAGFLFTALLLVALRRLLREASHDLLLARDRSEVAKSEFLANMSHEIRTPINGVLGMADLLSGTRLNDSQRMFVDTIIASGHALLGVINNVLDFSKIDAKQLELHCAPFRLSDLADEPLKLMVPMASTKRLELLARTAPDLPSHVVGDFTRLRQIVINLVANAVKFTQSGQVVVDVSGAETDGHVSIRVEVRDTGIGIHESHLGEVFDKFRQVDNSTTRQHEGTGLGLSISKGLVELMGGEIGVTSTVGEGATFWFTATLLRAASGAQDHPPSPALNGRNVLVIDANETSRGILEELLGAWRMRPRGAASGREALRLMRAAARAKTPFDLVILDEGLVGRADGDVLDQIRATLEIADTPILLRSDIFGGAVTDWREKADAVLPKLARTERLRNAIIAALDPASRSPRNGVISEAEPDAAGDGGPREFGAEIRVLVAEDNEVNAFVAEQVMQSIGVSYERAINGAEAVEKFRNAPPSIVLMDVSMPVMNGYEATGRIRAMEAELGLAPIPIIGLTAHALEGDRERCLEAGMDDYIAKPFPVEALREILRKWLREEPAAAA